MSRSIFRKIVQRAFLFRPSIVICRTRIPSMTRCSCWIDQRQKRTPPAKRNQQINVLLELDLVFADMQRNLQIRWWHLDGSLPSRDTVKMRIMGWLRIEWRICNLAAILAIDWAIFMSLGIMITGFITPVNVKYLTWLWRAFGNTRLALCNDSVVVLTSTSYARFKTLGMEMKEKGLLISNRKRYNIAILCHC